MTADDAVTTIGNGLRRRARELRLAEEQLARFAFTEEAAPARGAGATPGWHRLALRALAVAADAENYMILQRVVQEGDATMTSIGEWLDADRLVTVDRVNALSQSGCAKRDLETDRVGATPLGSGLVALVDLIVAEAGAQAGT